MKPLKWYDHISVNLFWLGLNIRNNSVSSVLMPYMVAILAAPEIRNTALGGMRTAGLLIAMLVQPAMGILSDRSTSRFGRRRPFIGRKVVHGTGPADFGGADHRQAGQRWIFCAGGDRHGGRPADRHAAD